MSLLIDCASLTELSRVPLHLIIHRSIFSVVRTMSTIKLSLYLSKVNDGSGVLYRLAVHKNTLLLDEYTLFISLRIVESRAEDAAYSAAFVSSVVIVALW